MTLTTRPPYRAEHVGSLLPPPGLVQARAQRRQGAIDAAALALIEDRAIFDAVRRQEAAGLQSITDGALREGGGWLDALRRVEGATLRGDGDPLAAERFAFLKSLTTRTAKAVVASPTALLPHGAHVPPAHADRRASLAGAAAAWRVIVAQMAAAGCRYLQLEDTAFASLCDPRVRAACRDGGDDPDALARLCAQAIDAALRDRPADMAVVLHVRGFAAAWHASGEADAVTQALFSTDVDGYLIAFDGTGPGAFEPLRALRRYDGRDKRVVLGLVSVEAGAPQDEDALKRRIDEAAAVVPLERLCLSTQAGFADARGAEAPSPDEQWRRLAQVVEVATGVWG
jgi:5-methyltetrahydropteroyltriglutamate--homocysteine methyltransferase